MSFYLHTILINKINISRCLLLVVSRYRNYASAHYLQTNNGQRRRQHSDCKKIIIHINFTINVNELTTFDVDGHSLLIGWHEIIHCTLIINIALMHRVSCCALLLLFCKARSNPMMKSKLSANFQLSRKASMQRRDYSLHILFCCTTSSIEFLYTNKHSGVPRCKRKL